MAKRLASTGEILSSILRSVGLRISKTGIQGDKGPPPYPLSWQDKYSRLFFFSSKTFTRILDPSPGFFGIFLAVFHRPPSPPEPAGSGAQGLSGAAPRILGNLSETQCMNFLSCASAAPCG